MGCTLWRHAETVRLCCHCLGKRGVLRNTEVKQPHAFALSALGVWLGVALFGRLRAERAMLR